MSKRYALGYVCLLAGVFAAPPSATSQTPPSGANPGWVVIPVIEYTNLRARAYPAAAPAPAPPVDATLTRVDYDLQIRDDLATGRANLTVDVVKDGWVRIPIPRGLLVSDARLEGRPLSLVDGSAMLSKHGRSLLALNVALPIDRSNGAERLTLPASPSGITRASVTIGRQDIDVNVTGGLIAEKSDSPSETRWLAYARGDAPLSLSWRRKVEDHHITLPLRFRGSLTQLYGLGEDSTTLYAEAALEITQGAAAKARLHMPANVTVNQVLGANVGDWETKDGVLTVTFLDPAEKSAQFAISGEIRLPREGAVEVPLLDLLDAEHVSGGVGVDVIGAGELKDIKPIGLESVDPTVDSAEIGRLISSRQSPSLAAFRLAAAPNGARSLKVTVARYDQQAVLTANIEEARYNVLLSADGKDLVQARYAVRNNQRTFIKIAVPADATLWSASVSGAAVQPGKAPDGALLLPLAKAPAGEDAPPFAVELVYLTHSAAFADHGRTSLTLPSADLPISHAGLSLYYPQSFAIKAEAGKFRTQAFERPQSPALNGRPAPVATNRSQNSSQSDVLSQMNNNASQAASQQLIDRFRAQSAARGGPAPANGGPPFPTIGPSIYLVSELVGESQAPSVDLAYTKDKKGAVR